MHVCRSLVYINVSLKTIITCTDIFNKKKAKQCQVDKASKAFYAVLKLGWAHNLSISWQLDLFDNMVKPILLYC